MPQCLDWHYDMHLGKNNNKNEIGCIKPYQYRQKNKLKDVSIGLSLGEAMRSLETSPI